ncbi:unnamed protein product, partial [Dovyalis caffra]
AINRNAREREQELPKHMFEQRGVSSKDDLLWLELEGNKLGEDERKELEELGIGGCYISICGASFLVGSLN